MKSLPSLKEYSGELGFLVKTESLSYWLHFLSDLMFCLQRKNVPWQMLLNPHPEIYWYLRKAQTIHKDVVLTRKLSPLAFGQWSQKPPGCYFKKCVHKLLLLIVCCSSWECLQTVVLLNTAACLNSTYVPFNVFALLYMSCI